MTNKYARLQRKYEHKMIYPAAGLEKLQRCHGHYLRLCNKCLARAQWGFYKVPSVGTVGVPRGATLALPSNPHPVAWEPLPLTTEVRIVISYCWYYQQLCPCYLGYYARMAMCHCPNVHLAMLK